MSGFITTRHLFLQAPVIIKGFGFGVWVRGLWMVIRGRSFTFLALISGQV